MKRRNITYSIAALALGAISYGCGGPKAAPEEAKAPAESNIVTLSAQQLANTRLKTDTLSRKSISGTLRVSGQVDVPRRTLFP